MSGRTNMLNIVHTYFNMNLKLNIKEYRKKRLLTQEEIAKKLNITWRYYQKIESGSKIPSVDLLYKIKKILNVKIDDFLVEK